MVEASRFDSSATATVAATGIATASFQATQYKLEIDRVNVKQTTPATPTLESVATLYRDNVAPNAVIDITYTGSSGDTTPDPIYLEQGHFLIVQWSGADVGATMTVTISGWQSVPERGFRAVH